VTKLGFRFLIYFAVVVFSDFCECLLIMLKYLLIVLTLVLLVSAFSALTLLVERHEERLACKN